jgi:hypothetical protein
MYTAQCPQARVRIAVAHAGARAAVGPRLAFRGGRMAVAHAMAPGCRQQLPTAQHSFSRWLAIRRRRCALQNTWIDRTKTPVTEAVFQRISRLLKFPEVSPPGLPSAISESRQPDARRCAARRSAESRAHLWAHESARVLDLHGIAGHDEDCCTARDMCTTTGAVHCVVHVHSCCCARARVSGEGGGVGVFSHLRATVGVGDSMGYGQWVSPIGSIGIGSAQH